MKENKDYYSGTLSDFQEKLLYSLSLYLKKLHPASDLLHFSPHIPPTAFRNYQPSKDSFSDIKTENKAAFLESLKVFQNNNPNFLSSIINRELASKFWSI